MDAPAATTLVVLLRYPKEEASLRCISAGVARRGEIINRGDGDGDGDEDATAIAAADDDGEHEP